MVSLLNMQRVAKIAHDENGLPVVQIPLAVWEAVIGPVV
jgi:hypothetical protein